MQAMFIFETLDVFKGCKMQCQNGGNCTYKSPEQCRSIFLSMAESFKNPIHKQIKKSVDYSVTRVGSKNELTYKCPSCGYYHLLKHDTYCKHCGQRVEV